MFEALRANGLALAHAPQSIRESREHVFEAVRQNPQALPLAASTLQKDPDLQPECVSRNRLAAPGAAAPVVQASEAVRSPDGHLTVTAMRPSGARAALTFPGEGTLGDLASAAAAHFAVEGGLVHVSLPCGAAARPFDFGRRLDTLAPAWSGAA